MVLEGGNSEEQKKAMEENDKMVEEIFQHEDKDRNGFISHDEFSGPKHDELWHVQFSPAELVFHLLGFSAPFRLNRQPPLSRSNQSVLNPGKSINPSLLHFC